MKSVLISIKPQWCLKIMDGQKTIEVRKTRPNIETPFKCYIYATKSKQDKIQRVTSYSFRSGYRFEVGKVIGEFVCRYVSHSNEYLFDEKKLSLQNLLKRSCMTFEELNRYRGDKNIYAWDISGLKIYDKPKDLGEFKKYCEHLCSNCAEQYYGCKGKRITRPPQSWQYVEELED